MSKQQYIKALNKEIEKLNGVIDHKIISHSSYKREAQRHKELLRQIRREQRRQRSILSPFKFDFFSRV